MMLQGYAELVGLHITDEHVADVTDDIGVPLAYWCLTFNAYGLVEWLNSDPVDLCLN